MTKATLAKVYGWVGSALLAGGASNLFGRYSKIAEVLGAAILGGGTHVASDTSVTAPNGKV